MVGAAKKEGRPAVRACPGTTTTLLLTTTSLYPSYESWVTFPHTPTLPPAQSQPSHGEAPSVCPFWLKLVKGKDFEIIASAHVPLRAPPIHPAFLIFSIFTKLERVCLPGLAGARSHVDCQAAQQRARSHLDTNCGYAPWPVSEVEEIVLTYLKELDVSRPCSQTKKRSSSL